MGQWETAQGATDEWYTPKYIFDALDCRFDLDPAHPATEKTHVPTLEWYSGEGLEKQWKGFVWLNPPFGGRNGIVPWLDKFFDHGNGIALATDRTSAPWFQDAARRASSMLFMSPKVRFLRPGGAQGVSPANGTVLFASGNKGKEALKRAEGKLGLVLMRAF